MTYNAHGCVGTDGALDLDRTARVVAQQQPDLLALQELDVSQLRSRAVDQASELAERLQMQAHFTCALRRGGGQYGIALLASDKLRIEREGCLPARRDEVRAAQWARIGFEGFEIDILHTHLSIRTSDRNAQLKALLGVDWLKHRLSYPHLIVCGDLNAIPLTGVYRALSRRLRDVQQQRPGRCLATWPSFLPFARIDHIFIGRGFVVEACAVPKCPLTVAASDHLPLIADLRLLESVTA